MIQDSNGDPVKDAVIQVYGTDANQRTATVLPAAIPDAGQIQEVRQHKQRFVPKVTVIAAGTQIRFPNDDPFAHQVYSFSKAKRFELKLYKGDQHEPLSFHKPGIVQLGCNVHDNMQAYIVVSDAPVFGKTDGDGQFAVDLGPGDYRVSVWHARSLKDLFVDSLTVSESTPMPVSVELKLRPVRPVKRGLGAFRRRNSR